MIAVVLVGGVGTRLRPLTLHTPKQMLDIVDRPMLEWVVAGLARHGVDDVVLSLGYRPDAFRARYPDGRCAGVALHYAVEPEPLDTAGAIRFAALDAGIDERFLVCNGDVLTDLDVTALVAFHESSGAEATIALHQVEDPSAFGVVPTDEQGRVLAFVEKPSRADAPTDLINAGTYVVEPSVLERIEAGRRTSIERETFPAMAQDGTLYAQHDGGVYWLDTGTPLDYLQAQLDLIDGVRGVPPEAVSSAAVVLGRVEHSIVGAGATIEEDAEVVGSMVARGARVGAGAVVRDSILGPGSIVNEGAHVIGGSVLGQDAVVAPGAQLTGARLPEETS
jgi:mannose-1-phosphate guanylyltransferase